MEHEPSLKPTSEPAIAVAPDLEEAQMFFGGRAEHFIVCISDLVAEANWESADRGDGEEPDWEILDVANSVGAIRIGELTRQQYIVFRHEFGKACRGRRYIFGFRCEQPLASDAKMSLEVMLDKHDFLTDEQKKILDIALHIANTIRMADGCGDKNIVRQKQRKKGENEDGSAGGETETSKSKYRDFVRALVGQRIEDIVEERETKFHQIKEIISMLKKSDVFDGGDVPPDSAIRRGIGRVPEWKTRKKALAEARQKAGVFGKTYISRKKDDKRRGRVGNSMNRFVDVNNDGDGDDN